MVRCPVSVRRKSRALLPSVAVWLSIPASRRRRSCRTASCDGSSSSRRTCFIQSGAFLQPGQDLGFGADPVVLVKPRLTPARFINFVGADTNLFFYHHHPSRLGWLAAVLLHQRRAGG